MRRSLARRLALAVSLLGSAVGLALLFSGTLGSSLDTLLARLAFLCVALPALLLATELFRRKPAAPGFMSPTQEELEGMSLSDKQKRDFVAIVSHELRTPLTSIQGYAETLDLDLKRGDLSHAPEAIAVILRNADRLLELCGDLLSLSKLENATLAREALSTMELSKEVLTRLEPLRLAKGHEIHVETEASEIQGDSRLIGQVLTNLVENAIRYLPPMGKIQIRWAVEPAGVLLKVSDNGPGIAPEHHPRLFERFYRIDDGRARTDGGTGLGLAVVKNIVLKHDGKVWIESRLGRGAAFFCYFPNVS